MDKNILFRKTLGEIEKKMKSKDEYEIFMISGLLRKLLIDDDPLINQVNKTKRMKITFTVNDRKFPLGDKSLRFYSMEDGFDPNTSVPHLAHPIPVSRDQLLERQLMIINGEIITVLDLIKFLSNVQGAVHVGKPKNSKENVLREIQKYFSIGGLPAGIRSILSVSRVVLKGLEPLKSSID